ncbi:molybdenum cofactor biosynthesis protein MoaE [Gulosibacter sp. 10]|uniref:molybdenum cofactor biosynthesis protein MoaE n=1 Tax=Gulosibacter sp. 10 TaxID=1255570 RepID=UPI00097F5F04|nr:molybdenum cofactor biosynthesis protein MoaE [Gulosibacter sp. 10]SJM70976.1 Molybdenum cofactor biosynthesis protein MoaE [Gulosibacter sp. 10]
MSVAIAALADEPLDIGRHFEAVSRPDAGAVASFVGVVRDHDPEAEGAVELLEYSAHPEAGRRLRELAGRVDAPALTIAVTHRVGALRVGDAAIAAFVSSPHRAEAFDACRELVELVKRELPVWKRQRTADGASHWVGIS